MAAARGGSRGALERLLRRHHDRLYALCRRMTGNDADAADATQEALVSIVRGLSGFEGGSRFGTWAYRVAVNACLDELRRRDRRPRPGLVALGTEPSGRESTPDRAGAGGETSQTAGGPWSRGGSPIPVDELVADRVDIDAALAHVTPELRSAVVLRDLCGLDYAEIAEVLDLPGGTVRSRISRGRLALAALLEGNRAEGSPRPSERT